jgi:hypothetical protein
MHFVERIEALLGQPAFPGRGKRLYEAGVALSQAITVFHSRPVSDFPVMIQAFEAAAQDGYLQAWVELGRCHWNGWGVAQDRAAAMKMYAKASKLGLPYADYVLAMNYYWVFHDFPKARRYCERAIRGGDPHGDAHCLMGYMALGGRGRRKSEKDSRRLHEEAARRGNADSLFELFCLSSVTEDARAIRYLRRAANKGHPRACYNLGAFHATGTRGFPKDLKKAVQWYERASDAGNGQASANLGLMYLKGTEIPGDAANANRYFDLGKKQGFDVDGWLRRMGITTQSGGRLT